MCTVPACSAICLLVQCTYCSPCSMATSEAGLTHSVLRSARRRGVWLLLGELTGDLPSRAACSVALLPPSPGRALPAESSPSERAACTPRRPAAQSRTAPARGCSLQASTAPARARTSSRLSCNHSNQGASYCCVAGAAAEAGLMQAQLQPEDRGWCPQALAAAKRGEVTAPLQGAD